VESDWPFNENKVLCQWLSISLLGLQHSTVCNCDQSRLMERDPKESISPDLQWGSHQLEIQINHTLLQGLNFASTRQQGGSLNNLDIQPHKYNIFYYHLSIVELLTTTIIYRRVQHNTCSILTLAKSSTVSLSDFSRVDVPPVLLSQNLY
jgi:hypothetical protein